jgi:uncharacterized protein (TIGR02118 family)
MMKIVALIRKPEDMPHAEFLQHWQVDHPQYVWALPGVRRYVQNAAVQNRKSWPFDGCAELWFDSVKDVAIAFDSAQAGPMHQHEERFISELTWFLAEESEVPAPQVPHS